MPVDKPLTNDPVLTRLFDEKAGGKSATYLQICGDALYAAFVKPFEMVGEQLAAGSQLSHYDKNN